MDVIETVSRNVAEYLRDRIVENIMRADKFVPNAPATIRKKGFNHPLYETGLLSESIEYTVDTHGNNADVIVGVFNPERAEIAVVNEYGNDRIPSRPFLRLTFDENIDNIVNIVGDGVVAYLNEVL